MSAEQGRAARDAGIALVEEATDEWQRAVVDQAIREMAKRGRPFSANDVREVLPPGVRPALVGARFMAASVRKELREVGRVASTSKATHAHRITLWEAA